MTEAGQTGSSTPLAGANRRVRWWRLALVASLAINALLAGVVLRSLWHVRSGAVMAAGGGLEANLNSYVNTLPDDRRKMLRHDAGSQQAGAVRPLRIELRRARADAARLFLAEPFDRRTFAAAQARVLDAEINVRRAVQLMAAELGERMTVDERRTYFRSFAGGRDFMGHRGGGPEGGPGGGPGGKRRGGQLDGERTEERNGPQRRP